LTNQKRPNDPINTDAALRASANGRSESKWFSSYNWFQSDRRAARIMRGVTLPFFP